MNNNEIKDFQESNESSKQDAFEMQKNDYKMSEKQKSSKYFGKITSGLLIILIVLCAFFGGYTASSLLQSEDAAVSEWLVKTLNEEAYFLDYEGFDASFLLENGLSFSLRNDPYCNLMTPEETNEYYATSNGSSTSFGLTVGTFEEMDGVYVMSVVNGSSAEKEGLGAGMRIYSIDGIDLFEKTMDDVSEILLNKEENATAEVTCIIPLVDISGNLIYDVDCEKFSATIIKQEYTPIVVSYFDNSNEGFENLDDKTGYVRITSFVGKTASQFDDAMAKFKENGKTNLILDLRDNSGGSEENMQSVASYLITDKKSDENPLIITIEDKNQNVREIHSTANLYDGMNYENVIVLVNGVTASASEAILTAMIDYDTVDLIIGETTFGKGTGLTTAFMPIYGYSVTFTSSYYFSPNGNSHDQVGLSPTNGYYMLDNRAYPFTNDNDDILQRAINSLK